jgi:hypothetical protein
MVFHVTPFCGHFGHYSQPFGSNKGQIKSLMVYLVEKNGFWAEKRSKITDIRKISAIFVT